MKDCNTCAYREQVNKSERCKSCTTNTFFWSSSPETWVDWVPEGLLRVENEVRL